MTTDDEAMLAFMAQLACSVAAKLNVPATLERGGGAWGLRTTSGPMPDFATVAVVLPGDTPEKLLRRIALERADRPSGMPPAPVEAPATTQGEMF